MRVVEKDERIELDQPTKHIYRSGVQRKTRKVTLFLGNHLDIYVNAYVGCLLTE
jgi:hypothetical protein